MRKVKPLPQEKNGRKKKETKSDGKYRVILQLHNEIMNLKRSKREGKKPFKKKNNTNTSPQVPPTSGINLEDSTMDKFCHTHYANHLEKTCLKFINSFKEMLLPQEPLRKDEQDTDGEEKKVEVEEEEGAKPSSNLHLILDDNDDVMEEACVGNDYNLWSKGVPKSNDYPST